MFCHLMKKLKLQPPQHHHKCPSQSLFTKHHCLGQKGRLVSWQQQHMKKKKKKKIYRFSGLSVFWFIGCAWTSKPLLSSLGFLSPLEPTAVLFIVPSLGSFLFYFVYFWNNDDELKRKKQSAFLHAMQCLTYFFFLHYKDSVTLLHLCISTFIGMTTSFYTWWS